MPQNLKNRLKNHVLPVVAVGCMVVTAGIAYHYSKKNLLEINDASMNALKEGKYLVMKMDSNKILGMIITD